MEAGAGGQEDKNSDKILIEIGIRIMIGLKTIRRVNELQLGLGLNVPNIFIFVSRWTDDDVQTQMN